MQNEYSSLVKFLNDQTQFFFDINNYEYVDKRKSADSIYFYKYILKDKRTLEKFVFKILKKEYYVDDLSRMMICKCPSILGIKGFSLYNDKEPSILTNFFYITLHDYIDKKRKGLSSSTKTDDYIIILGITIGLRYLHKNGIIHETLCPDSILLDENLYPIIQNVELLKKFENENISDFFTMCWHTNPERRLTFDEIFGFITKEEFYEYFEPFDHYQVKAYLDEYGNEFDEIKKRFE